MWSTFNCPLHKEVVGVVDISEKLTPILFLQGMGLDLQLPRDESCLRDFAWSLLSQQFQSQTELLFSAELLSILEFSVLTRNITSIQVSQPEIMNLS